MVFMVNGMIMRPEPVLFTDEDWDVVESPEKASMWTLSWDKFVTDTMDMIWSISLYKKQVSVNY